MDEKTDSKRKNPTGFRLSEKAKVLLHALSEKHGVNNTAIIEMAIREKAERDNAVASEQRPSTRSCQG